MQGGTITTPISGLIYNFHMVFSTCVVDGWCQSKNDSGSKFLKLPSLNNEINLNDHVNFIHEGIRYACQKCDHKATSPGNLTKHIQNKHEDAKFVCDQCVQKFQSKNALDTHYNSIHVPSNIKSA